MISVFPPTPQEMLEIIASKAKQKRLSLNLSQKTLAELSGVSYGVLKKFERIGQISLESLLKLSLPLDSLEEFSHLFEPKELEMVKSLDELMKEDKTRKRGRK